MREKSILIHTYSFVGTKVAKKIAIDDSGKDGSVYNSDDFHLELDDEYVPVPYTGANKWCIIEDTNSGLKFSSAFPDLNELEYAGHRYAVSGLIGSSLYVLGGVTRILGKKDNTIACRMDINKYKDAGWEPCNPLEYVVKDSMKVGFFGKYIYYFSPPTIPLSFCYIYDTSTQMGTLIEKPPCYGMGADICVPLEGKGLLIIDLPSRLFYINNPDHGEETVWRKCENYQSLPFTNLTFGFLLSVLNGMLYICDTVAFPIIKLYAYDCWKGRLLYEVELPKKLCRHLPRRLRRLSGRYCPRHLVAISDSKLCLLWNFADHVFCALVFVPPVSNPSPEIVDVRFFRAVGERNLEIISCQSVDASLGQMAKISTLFDQTRKRARESCNEDASICQTGRISRRRTRGYLPMRPFSKFLMLNS